MSPRPAQLAANGCVACALARTALLDPNAASPRLLTVRVLRAQLVAEKRAAADGAFPLLDEVRKQANDPNRVSAYLDGHPAGAALASFPAIGGNSPPLAMHAGICSCQA